jgi:uncharacterized protein (TIGR03066 family)
MRVILGLALLAVMGLAAGANARADDKDVKIDAKKLIGKWTPKEEKEKFTVEFMKDGKMKLNLGDMSLDGTYKLEGNKLALTIKFGDKEEKMNRVITKVTDTEIVSRKDEEGAKEDTLVRVKYKK